MQRAQANEPKLANVPLVLSARDSRRGLLVAAANLAARKAGIRATMRLSEATALVALEIREHDPQEDIEALRGLAEQAQQFSPIVGLEQLDKKLWAGRTIPQPESLLLDVTGLAGLFGGEEALVQAISRWLDQHNYFGYMAIAGTVGAAWAMANYGTRRLVPPPTPASPASRLPSNSAPATRSNRLPVGETQADVAAAEELEGDALVQRIVPESRAMSVAAGGDARAVGSLPLAALRLPPETITSLQRLGLRTIAELEQLPRAGLATRLGERLLDRWDQAFGLKAEPIVTLAPLDDWSLEQTLEIPTEHRETMLEIVRRMSHSLSGRLARRGEGALRLVCRLDLVKRPSIVMQLGLFRPTNDAAHLEMLLAGQLEQQLRSVRTAPLWRISLQATLTAPMVWRQVDLFSGGEVLNRHEIARLVDTLSCRLGRKNVLSSKTRRESQPELASSFQPMTGRRQDGSEQETVRKLSSRLAQGEAQPSRDEPLRRPIQLLNPPVAIEVAGAWSPHQAAASPPAAAATISTADNPQALPPRNLATAPARFHYQQVWHHVLEATGPERLESGWWKGPSVRRDYYRIATDKGGWWWIYRDLNNGQWHLHGLFD